MDRGSDRSVNGPRTRSGAPEQNPNFEPSRLAPNECRYGSDAITKSACDDKLQWKRVKTKALPLQW